MPATFYLGLLLLFVFGLHAREKWRLGLLPELLWACNVNNFLMGLGLVFGLRWLTAVSFLFHVGVGLTAYFLERLAKREAYEREIFMHFAPVLIGYTAFKETGVPFGSSVGALLVLILIWLISFYGTNPSLNINVIHTAWGPVRERFATRMWLYRALNGLLCLLFLLVAEVVCSRLLFVYPTQ